MRLEHVNHFEREGVLPIAFSLFHIVNMMDASFMLITGQMPIWNDDWNSLAKSVSPFSTQSNAGSTSTGCGTWARSSWRAASSAWAA